MNVLRLATNASERGDHVRAVILLTRALKRQHDVDGEAFDLLINTYANCCTTPGLEQDVCDIIARHFDAGYVSGQIIARLEERSLFAMARAFRRAIEARGVWIEEVELLPQPELPLTEEVNRQEEIEPLEGVDTFHDIEPSDADTNASPESVDEPGDTTEIPRQLDLIGSGSTPTLDEIHEDHTPEDGDAGDTESATTDSDDVDVEALGDSDVEEQDAKPVSDSKEQEQDQEQEQEEEERSQNPPDSSPSFMLAEEELEEESSEVDVEERDAAAPDDAFEDDNDEQPEEAPSRDIADEFTDAANADEVHGEVAEPALKEEEDPDASAEDYDTSSINQAHASPPSRSWVVALTITILLTVAGSVGWMSISRSAQMRAVDQQLEMFDPLHPEGFEAALERARQDGEDVATRERFLTALLALERGEVSETPEVSAEEQEDPWAHGASALAAMQRKDFETALRHTTTIERTDPEELATLWVRARLEEERGEFIKAREAYARALERFPRFVPGVVGQMRVAYRTDDAPGLERAATLLRALNPIHPYLRISEQPILEIERDYLSLIVSGHTRGSVEAHAISQDRFLNAYQHYYVALRAWRRGERMAASKSVKEALAQEPYMSPALMLQGALLVTEGQLDEAGKMFSRLVRVPGATVAMRLAVMVVAPRMFSQWGRPEHGFIFTLALPDGKSHAEAHEASSEEQQALYNEWRAVSLNLTREQLEQERELGELAARELAQVFLDLGDGERCLRALAELEERGALSVEARLIRLLAFFMLGDRQRLADAVYHLKGEPEEHIAQTIMHLLEGDWKSAQRSSSSNGEQMKRHPFWLRVRALALLARDRPEEVLQMLDALETSTAYRQTTDRLRLRAWAKMAPEQGEHFKELAKSKELVSVEQSTHVHALIDMGAAYFWRGDMERAKSWMSRALERAPRHPEANWFMGLILRHEGNRKASLQHLTLASVETEDDPRLLLELGQVYLALGRNMLAQKMFYKAVLLDRKDLRALRGLGRSYKGWDHELGKRDLTRILASYEYHSGFKAQAAETLLWLAILHGSRDGKPEALPYIKRAIAAAGPLGELLVEEALYFERSGNLEQAGKLYVKALRRDSTLASAHVGLARIALRSKKRRMARDHLVKYLELEPYGADVDWARKELEQLVKKKSEE